MEFNIVEYNVFVESNNEVINIDSVVSNKNDQVNIIVSNNVESLEIVGSGPQGIAGPTGPQGPVGLDLTHVHYQISPENTWNIFHNLGKFPSVSVVDSAGSLVIGDVDYNDINNVTIFFTGAFGGKAYLN